MDRIELLALLRLLSALESWSFADGHRLPAYLQEQLSEAINTITTQVLKDTP